MGCKHCQCRHFVHEEGAPRISPFERMQRFGQWHVRLNNYLLQWEQLGSAIFPSIEQYLGATVQEWLDATEPPKPMARESGYGHDDSSYEEIVV